MLRRVALVRTTRRNIPEDIILHSNRRENLKSFIVILFNKFLHYSEIQLIVSYQMDNHLQKLSC
jgi:hypothetical protein